MKNWYVIALIALLFSACRDDEFDTPPTTFVDPGLEATHTIAELKTSHILGEFYQIDEEMVLTGIISADDRSGNFYQRLIVEDGTAGIEILLRANDLFNLYPAGRRIYILAKDMWIGDYNGVIQLGGSVEEDGSFLRVNGVEEVLIPDFIVGGALEGVADPLEVSISDLGFDHISRLVKMDEVEFSPGSRNVAYADGLSNPPQSINHLLQDCNGNTIIVRTSGYCDFAGSITPSGNGTITAVYSVFGSDQQLFIRDTTDVNMLNPTCSQNIQAMDISEIRDMYMGSDLNAPAVVVEAIVISDRANGNINGQNAVVQQEGGDGIVLRYNDDHSFDLGTKVRANLTGGTIGDFNGLVQVSGLEAAQTEVLATGQIITPQTVSVNDILTGHDDLESTLIELENINLSGATWGDGVTVSDASGSIPVFTFFSASFSGASVPPTLENMTAIVGDFNGPQLNLRNEDDFGGGGNTGGDPVLVTVEDIQAIWTGSTTTISEDYKIQGVVISDYQNGNITGRNLVLQDGSRGIVVRFTDNHSYPLGENIEVVVTGQELSEYNGLLQVNNVPPENAQSESLGLTVAPNVVTIAEILADPFNMESTLVQIEGASISGSSTFEGSTTVTDASGSIPMYTRSDASFAGNNLPAGPVTMVAIVSDFNEPQINIRNIDDIQE